MDELQKRQQEFAKRVGIGGADFEDWLKRSLLSGTAHPQMIIRLIDYFYGKPVDKTEVVVKHQHSLEGKTNEELAARAREIAGFLDTLVGEKKLLAENVIDAEIIKDERT